MFGFNPAQQAETESKPAPQSRIPFLRAFRNRRHWIDIEKDTQFTDAWIILALILAGVGMLFRNHFFTTFSLLLLILVGIAWLWGTLSLYGLHYRRHFAEIRAFQGETIELTLELANQKFLPLTWVSVYDIFPPTLPVKGVEVTLNRATNQGEFRTFWMPNAFQKLSRRFQIECTERGFHRFGPARVETGDGFGFFGRKARFLDEQFFIVYPRVYSVAEMDLPSKNPFGSRQSRGHLFADPMRTIGIREWQSGDSPRLVHWKASARHQRLLSRVHEPSREEQLMVFVNVATLERHWHGTIPELLERVISVAASMAAVAAADRLPVGIIANGTLPGSDQPIRLLPGRSPQQMTRILELLAAVTPFASGSIESLLLGEAPRLSWGATILVVTAIAHEEILATLLELAEAGRPVVLVTLAKEPPREYLRNIKTYHLPHLIDDLILPQLVGDESMSEDEIENLQYQRPPETRPNEWVGNRDGNPH